jgi:hypothetical protein
MTQNLPPELTAQLTRMIRRVRMILLARGILAVAAVTVGSILAIMGVDAAVVLYHPRRAGPSRWRGWLSLRRRPGASWFGRCLSR